MLRDRRLTLALALLLAMPFAADAGRDGSGVYSLPSVYDVDPGDTIQPEQLETPLEDIETDLNTPRPIVAGGTGGATAAAARSNLSVQPITRANDTTGSSNSYALASEVAFTSLTDGDFVLFVANHSNTGAATLNVDGLGAKDLQKAVSGTPTALASGDINAGGHYLATYDASVGSGTWIVHKVDSSSALTDIVDDTTPQLGGNLDVNGNTITSASDGDVVLDPDGTGEIQLGAATVTVEQDIQHSGDADNKIAFGTDTQDFQTGGSSRLDLSDSGVRLGGANARVNTVLDEDDMASDSATSLATQQSIKAYVNANAGGATTVQKTADEGLSSSDTLQDDDDLAFTMTANKTYEFKVRLFLTNDGTSPDWKFGWALPTGATMYWGTTVPRETAGALLPWRQADTSDSPVALLTESDTLTHGGANVGVHGVILEGIVICGGTGGDLQFQWAQNVSGSGTNTVKAHSHLIVRELGDS